MSTGAFMRLPAAVPVRRLSAAQREALALRLLPAWRAWCADWSLARADVRVEPLVQGATRARESGREALIAAAMDLPGETAWAEDSLAASFAASVETSWRAWRDGWLGAVTPADEAPAGETAETAKAAKAASAADLGELVLTFSCVRTGDAASAEPVERTVRVAAASLMALLPSGSASDAAASASSRPALSPLPRAIAHLPVRVRVHLGQAALQMGQLMDLQPGDVIPLAHPLARPAGLTFAEPDGLPLAAEARLGRSGPHWAVRVDPAPPPTS